MANDIIAEIVVTVRCFTVAVPITTAPDTVACSRIERSVAAMKDRTLCVGRTLKVRVCSNACSCITEGSRSITVGVGGAFGSDWWDCFFSCCGEQCCGSTEGSWSLGRGRERVDSLSQAKTCEGLSKRLTDCGRRGLSRGGFHSGRCIDGRRRRRKFARPGADSVGGEQRQHASEELSWNHIQ